MAANSHSTRTVSVLIPARDAAATLDVCLRSVARQTLESFECIVVDDGSRDDTAARAADHARRDPRFRLLRTERRGLVHALSAGLEECTAPIVARMDADDWMHRARLSQQQKALEREPGLAAVGCHVRLFPRGPVRQGVQGRRGRREYEAWLNSLRTPEDVARESFVECPIAHPTLVARREIFQAFPYRDVDWPEDYDWVLRVLHAGHAIGVVPERLLGWRDGLGRLSRRDPRYDLDRFTACKAAHLTEGLLAPVSRYVLWGYGQTGRRLRRALVDLGREPSHIVEVHPRRLGERIHGAPVVAPEALRDLRDRPVVASVAGRGPRARIRRELTRMGFRECIDFVCAA